MVEYLENFKLKDDLGDKPFNFSSSEGGGESSGSGKKPEQSGSEYNSILDDPRNYGYGSDSSDDYDPHNYETDEEPDSNVNDRNSQAMGASLEDFKSSLKNENDSEAVQNMKKDFEDAIKLYEQGISPEAEKQIAILKEKVENCDNKISELETESKSKGKGKA